jgi:hypothetical protein
MEVRAMMKNDMKPATHVYIGRKECGCCVAVVTDLMDKSTGKSVAEFIGDGLIIKRVSFPEYREMCKEETFMGCTHGQAKLL